MAENKTKPTEVQPLDFINSPDNPQSREDCLEVMKLMEELTGEPPVMWGPSIVGFGKYHYKYASGREGDFMRTGFSPRKANLTLYIMMGFDRYGELMSRLGKYKTGKSCLYIKKLSDIDIDVLRELIEISLKHLDEYFSEK